VALVALGAPAAHAEPAAPAASWKAFVDARSGRCLGPRGELAAPITIEAKGHRYELRGSTLVQLDKDADSVLRIGVISATKDDREPTLAAITELVRRFEKRGVDLIVANGDLATDEFEMEAIFPAFAGTGLLVVATIGNTESCGSFNKIAAATFESKKNLVNGNWVRRLELDDGTLLTLPGYYDRKFTHTGGASCYVEKDLEELRAIAKGAPPPLVLVSHGPPKTKVKTGIDVAYDGSNVGDAAMTELVRDLAIPFGLFGHILEAGGRGSDLDGKARAPKAWHPTLYVNAGSANPDPWRMLDGKSSNGLGLYVEIDTKRGRFDVERLDPPAE
ncbi:metallophosphoesterase, partial [Myxococcota bacterium]|nr:metallophosphoesterase [Myxococcota bacterium]